MIWMMEPAFLTIVSMTLLLLALADYLVPIVASTFISSSAWNGQKERKLDEICQSVSEILLQAQAIWKFILNARSNRPNFVSLFLFLINTKYFQLKKILCPCGFKLRA